MAKLRGLGADCLRFRKFFASRPSRGWYVYDQEQDGAAQRRAPANRQEPMAQGHGTSRGLCWRKRGKSDSAPKLKSPVKTGKAVEEIAETGLVGGRLPLMPRRIRHFGPRRFGTAVTAFRNGPALTPRPPGL